MDSAILDISSEKLANPTSPDDAQQFSPALTEAQQFSPALRIVTFLAIVFPFLGLIGAIGLHWGYGISVTPLVVFLVMYTVTGLGITVGFHRLLTHRSFETTRWIKCLLSIAGSMAVQGPVLEWVATHRRHHQHSDEELDPHSPNPRGAGILGILRGLWHSHVGWLLKAHPDGLSEYVRDLSKDPMLQRVNALFPLWVIMGLFLPALIVGLITMSWYGALAGFLWGGLVRVFFVHHVTWSVNSACHIWGSRPYKTGDRSRNNLIFGILAWGEGWHNNHHAFPTSARHGLRWWQFDLSHLVIRTLEALKLAWNVRVPKTA